MYRNESDIQKKLRSLGQLSNMVVFPYIKVQFSAPAGSLGLLGLNTGLSIPDPSKTWPQRQTHDIPQVLKIQI